MYLRQWNHEFLIQSSLDTGDQVVDNFFGTPNEAQKDRKTRGYTPNDKIEFNKLFDSQANDTKCGKSCQFSKKKVFEKKQNKELIKELKRHGIHTKSGKKSVLRTLLKSHYEEHGLDVSNLPSWFLNSSFYIHFWVGYITYECWNVCKYSLKKHDFFTRVCSKNRILSKIEVFT